MLSPDSNTPWDQDLGKN